jgi:hypothetical protein
MPIETWIEFVSFEMQDTEEGNFQVLYSTRKVNDPILADFAYKTECDTGNGYKTSSEMFFIQKEVPLPCTNGKVQTVSVDMYLPYELPKGRCRTYITIKTNIKGYERHVADFVSEYNVF